MKRYLAILALLPLLAMGGRQQGMGPGPGMPASSGGGGYSDNFPGSTLSGNWSYYTGTGYGAPVVGSSQVYNDASGSNSNFLSYTGGTFGANQTSQATIGPLSFSPSYYLTGQPAGVCIHTDTSGNGYCTSAYGIMKCTATSCTVTACYAWYAAIGQVISIANVGSALTMSANGVTQCTATDSTYTGGYPGLAIPGRLDGIYLSWSTWSGY